MNGTNALEKSLESCVTMDRDELKRIHDLALAVAQMCRGKLGWELLPTRATQRKASEQWKSQQSQEKQRKEDIHT